MSVIMLTERLSMAKPNNGKVYDGYFSNAEMEIAYIAFVSRLKEIAKQYGFKGFNIELHIKAGHEDKITS